MDGDLLKDHFLRTWMGRADVQLSPWGLSVPCCGLLNILGGWLGVGGQVPGPRPSGWWGLGCDGKQVNPGVVD